MPRRRVISPDNRIAMLQTSKKGTDVKVAYVRKFPKEMR
jgi:hypothetical protein